MLPATGSPLVSSRTRFNHRSLESRNHDHDITEPECEDNIPGRKPESNGFYDISDGKSSELNRSVPVRVLQRKRTKGHISMLNLWQNSFFSRKPHSLLVRQSLDRAHHIMEGNLLYLK